MEDLDVYFIFNYIYCIPEIILPAYHFVLLIAIRHHKATSLFKEIFKNYLSKQIIYIW